MRAAPAKRPHRAADAADGAETEAARMQQAISARARRFALAALLDALHALGYSDEEIEFQSHATSTHQASVIDAVRFAGPPRRRVTVVLNLGLLAPQSPLPSYFQQVLERQVDGALSGFLNFFSHRLLAQGAQGQFPERDGELFASWTGTLAEVRSLLGLRTLTTLHWIFDALYPELGVSVQRVVLSRPVYARSTRLGPWQLGDGAVLGGQAQVPVSGVAVKLFCDESTSGTGAPWAKEAERRLRSLVFPLLAGHGIHLQVSLILRDQRSFLVLRPQEFLGYTPLYPGATATPPARSARTIVLWSGEVPAA